MAERLQESKLGDLLASGFVKLYVCPVCLDTSTNAVPCYGRENEKEHDPAELLRVGPWGVDG
jgi:hypothetical protein